MSEFLAILGILERATGMTDPVQGGGTVEGVTLKALRYVVEAARTATPGMGVVTREGSSRLDPAGEPGPGRPTIHVRKAVEDFERRHDAP